MKPKYLILATLMAVFLVTGCTPSQDWDDPKWIAHAMKHNHPRAFSAYMALDDDQRLELLPNVIEVYNANMQQREALRALLTVSDSRVIEVYHNALARADDQLALLGARGLVQEGANDAGGEIAERLKSVTTEDTFLGFVEALGKSNPSTETIEVIAGVAQRPADKIGGVSTVKAACDIMAQAQSASPEIVRGIVIGLVNFTARPNEDPVHECEMAAIAHKDAVLEALVELYNGENERANAIVKEQGFSDATARMRAAMVLGHLKNHGANDAIRGWLKTRQTVARAQLESMRLEEQQAWYDNHGQLFEISVKALSYERNAKDAALLRSLMDPNGNLKNFESWFALSEGAELGLRQAAATALVGVSQDKTSRDLLWKDAREGRIARGSEQTDTLYHLNVLHALGRIATTGDLASFKRAVAAQPERWTHEFRSLYGYFVLGEACENDLQCRKDFVLDPDELMDRKDVKAWIAAEDEERREGLTKALRHAIQAGGVWQIAILGGDEAASAMLVDLLKKGPEVAQTAVPEALLFCRSWADTVSEDLTAWIEENKRSNRLSGWSGLRSLLEVVAELSKT